MLRRRIWLAGIAAAVFVLQGPLCAFACVENPEVESGVADHQQHPCHEEAPSSSPADAPRSHEGCGCELVTAVPLPNLELSQSAPALAFVPPSTSSEGFARVVVQWARSAPERTDLPPPDILLLKSTLLI